MSKKYDKRTHVEDFFEYFSNSHDLNGCQEFRMTYSQGKLNPALKESRRSSTKDDLIQITIRRCLHREKISLISVADRSVG